METKFDFKSSPCTSIEQSKRLLALGLKKETADMVHCPLHMSEEHIYYLDPEVLIGSLRESVVANDEGYEDYIPAWSLSRIRELLKNSQVTLSFFEDGDYVVVERYGVFQNILDQRVDMWDNLCDAFQYLITEGYFNKEYFV